jgi:pSer/pThr/pTyr-binding forkhead associated (FHA) protein
MPPEPTPLRHGTLIETDDEVREALQNHLRHAPASPPIPAAASPWRPTRRPPVATLVVWDDGKTDGEVIRLRDVRFVIGRTEGDLLIPHDELVSTRHVEITRQQVGGLFRWVITDLQSTNGLFIRVTKTALADRAEILVGNGRYRFEAPDVAGGDTVDPLPGGPKSTGHTVGEADAGPPVRPTALTELVPGGIGNRTVLIRGEYWIGSAADCAIGRPDDPFCEPRHCRLFRGKGGWFAEHPRTANGLWLKVPQVVVDKSVKFQIGEQRFQLRV